MKKVYLTARFQKQYLKKFTKYFSKEEFVRQIKNKEHTMIDLHFPYMKIKNKFGSVAVRGVVFIIFENHIVPLLLFLKKDKNNGENIRWTSHEALILEAYELVLKDIENGDFEII